MYALRAKAKSDRNQDEKKKLSNCVEVSEVIGIRISVSDGVDTSKHSEDKARRGEREKVEQGEGVQVPETSEDIGDSEAKAKNDRYQNSVHVEGNEEERKGYLYSVIKEVV